VSSVGTREPSIVSHAHGSIKGHGHPPSKAIDFRPIRTQASSSLSSRKLIHVLLRQHIHTSTSFLKLYTPSSYWSNKEKVDIGYYALVAQITLKLSVLLNSFTLAMYHPPSPHQGFLTSSLQISKRVPLTIPVSNHNDSIYMDYKDPIELWDA
jgi:hypothetical protein